MADDQEENGWDEFKSSPVSEGEDEGPFDNLPPALYPREVETRSPNTGFYVALGLVLSVWMITPLSCAYLVWYTLLGRAYFHGGSLTATLLASYALTETVFAVYYHYLVAWCQKIPAPPSQQMVEYRKSQLRRVLRQNLQPHLLRRAVGEEDDGLESKTWAPRRYRRCRHLTDTEADVIGQFVEKEPGDRERRLREQVEENVVAGEAEGMVVDRHGSIRILHVEDPRAIEFRERLRTWFNHASWSKVKRDNVVAWLSWLLFGSSPTAPAAVEKSNAKFLTDILGQLEARTGGTFEKGFNKDLETMRLTLDPVPAKGRPLAIYAMSTVANWLVTEVAFPALGVGKVGDRYVKADEKYREGRIEYLLRMPSGWSPRQGQTDPNATPVVFFHGLGFGMIQNQLFLRFLLKALPKHPVVIPSAPHTAQAIFNQDHLQPWTRNELTAGMDAICRRWGFWERTNGTLGGGISVLSHSNGSVAHAWMLQAFPQMIKRNTFVDPVVFCLWEGDVCHSFCYRTPTTVLELLLYYFIASEVGIANYIQRHFDWAENTLFVEDIPSYRDSTRTAFFLGGHDLILDTSQVRRYLERQGVSAGIHWDSEGGHGDALSGASRERVINFVATGFTQGWEGRLRGLRRRGDS